jgi:hypothetical protein
MPFAPSTSYSQTIGETYRMPAWILWLMGISYTTVTLLVLGLEHKNVWAWLNGAPNKDGATAFLVWLGITGLEGFLVQFLLRAPFTWSVHPEGIRLRFGIWRNRRLAWSDLKRVEVVHVEPWDAGGYGVKLGPHGWTYAFFEGPGVRLDWATSGKKSVCFAFQDPEMGRKALDLASRYTEVSNPKHLLNAWTPPSS